MADYDFVKLTRADYPMLRSWLAQPHVREWWGEPDEEIAKMDEEVESGPTDMRIVHYKGTPFAYVQDWDVHHEKAPQFGDYPMDTRGIDTFLGEVGMLGQGHAPRYLHARAMTLLADGCPTVVIDPDPGNARAIHAYKKAGFHGDKIRPCEDGDPVLVMEFQPS